MTIRQALKLHKDVENDLFLTHILRKDKEFLHKHPDYSLTAAQAKRYGELCKKRAKGLPAAYLLGYRDFFGLRFKVNRATLIPRPESEWLVEQTLAYLKKHPGQTKVIDIGTGSGCLATSIAKHAPKNTSVEAIDISAKALAVAKTNATTNKVKVKFAKRDALKKPADKYNIVVANLPYVPLSEYNKHFAGIKYEPKSAITDDTETGELVLRFLTAWQSALKPKGVMLLEIDPLLEQPIRQWHKQSRSKLKLSFHKDLQGLIRYITLQTK